MGGFFVDPDDLECAAERLRVMGSRVDANSLLQYTISARSVGSEVLANALASFNQASRTALTSLRNQSTHTANLMVDSLRAYQEVEAAVAELMATNADSLPAPLTQPAARSG